MSTVFSVLRDIFAIIGVIGCVLVGVLFTFNAAGYWTSRRRERHLDQLQRAEAARSQYLQRALDKASRPHNGGQL